ncbi:glycosyl transferase family 1 [Rhizobium sp. Root149]|uniref:glycosyltransferase family 4 protein n=1 Tax=Rhizobium sp. Root149 TaxID=1736473 RepID=UPI0007132AEF|nr:glycosyltransferase family 4 protein [Rhizobium sp. Root149]KQZ60482.1 glycosyl transferase family 1 [Rhizobium sp. Root149]
MRVLHFFKTYWPDTFGGVERTIHALAKGCRAHGIEADVLSLSPSPKPEPFEFDDHRVTQMKCDLDVASTGFSREAFGAFRRLAKEADVINYHFPWPFMDMVEMVVPHGKPVVVTYHSDIVKQKLLLKLYSPLMHRFLARADRIIATSPNYLASSPVLQRHRDKVQVVPLGLAEADYPAADSARTERWRQRFPGDFFLFVGVLRYYKGIHVLYEAAKRTQLPIVVIGGGGAEEEFRSRAAADGLSNLHFLGPLEDTDKTALLSLCRALVFPSHLRSEAFGLSLVEAAMAGKPMISCEIGTGTSYVNLNGETGITIAPGDPQALACAMQVLWQDEALCARYGAAARLRYEAMFTADRMTAAYAQIYRDVAKSGKAGRSIS